MYPILFSEISCYLNTSLAWLGNGILVYLIVRKSPRSMANYKYLMLTFSTFGVLFGVIDITNQPMLHFFGGAYVIFSRNPLRLPRKLSFWYISLNCSCYGMTLSLLAFHFVYRYLAVCKPHKLHFFSYPYFNIPIGIFLFVTLEWWITAVLMAGESEEVDEYIKETMLETFGLEKNDYTYASSLFYRIDPITGMEHLSILDLVFVANISVIITTGFSIIIFCWLNLRSRLLESARQSHSQRTLDMQRQLFRALVAQTVLPVFVMFVPAAILLVFPLFRLEPGPSEALVLSLITTQPFIDALVPMYFIKDYRRAIKRFFGRNGDNLRVLQVSSVNFNFEERTVSRGVSLKN